MLTKAESTKMDSPTYTFLYFQQSYHFPLIHTLNFMHMLFELYLFGDICIFAGEFLFVYQENIHLCTSSIWEIFSSGIIFCLSRPSGKLHVSFYLPKDSRKYMSMRFLRYIWILYTLCNGETCSTAAHSKQHTHTQKGCFA